MSLVLLSGPEHTPANSVQNALSAERESGYNHSFEARLNTAIRGDYERITSDVARELFRLVLHGP